MKKIFEYGWDFYKKHEEGINYLIFGFLAFVLNFVLFNVLDSKLHINYLVATVLSWGLTVIFAYWTNRTFVFKSKNTGASSLGKEFLSFVGARIATEVLEVILMYFMVDITGIFSHDAAKLIGQVVVIVTNYILSKLWIFKEK